jgi:predicted metal-dependent HD superfamily phosphohydrolase
LLEQRRISDRLGEDSDPAARRDDVRGIAKRERCGDIGIEGVRLRLEGSGSSAKPLHQVRDEGRQHLVLAGEIVVYEAWRHRGLVGDGGDSCAGKTLPGEDSCERRDELGPTLLAQTWSAHRLVVHPIYCDEDGVMTTNLSTIAWPDVLAVGIRTTADGPFIEDVFWQFVLDDGFVEIPGGWINGAELHELRDHLPGIDWEKILHATGSTRERIFRVWHREESRFCPNEEDLAARYRALIRKLGGDAAAAKPVFDRVHAAWGEERRRYHGIEHLVDCLRELDGAHATSPTAELVELALWYHDVIYEPGAQACEERSAQMLLADVATLAIPVEAARAAADLVRSTAHASDSIETNTPATDLILDIDLSILGRDALRFMDFEYGVEEEYAAVSGIEFRVGRGRFLAALLARPRLFRTEYFRVRYEQRARVQIAALLASPRYRSYRWLRWLPRWSR